MKRSKESRRQFLKWAGLVAGARLLTGVETVCRAETLVASTEPTSADYTLNIKTTPIELASNRIVSATTYNGQFPGPLLRFREGRPVTIDIFNDTDSPEQLH